MSPTYFLLKLIWRFIFLQTIRLRGLRLDALRRQRGGFVLAVSHISHLEVVCTGLLTPRAIHWVTRKEFYCNRALTALLNSLGCIHVNRQGIPVSTIREGVNRSSAGQIVGIFPEGGVVSGKDLAIRGGPIKLGACAIAIRSGRPIIPCVVLGVEKLMAVKPWLPFRRGQVFLAFGEPLWPPERSTRASRAEMGRRLQASMIDLYHELQREYGFRDDDVP